MSLLFTPNEIDRYISPLPNNAARALASWRRRLALSRRWDGPHRHKVSKVHSPAVAAPVLLDRIDALVLLLAVLVDVLAVLDPALNLRLDGIQRRRGLRPALDPAHAQRVAVPVDDLGRQVLRQQIGRVLLSENFPISNSS